MTADKMKTENMSNFLAQVSIAHPDAFSIMVVDGASSHKSKDLKVPENVALVLLPPYSPDLNPAEQIWNRLRKITSPTRCSTRLMLRPSRQSEAYQRWRRTEKP
jgi:transposase